MGPAPWALELYQGSSRCTWHARHVQRQHPTQRGKLPPGFGRLRLGSARLTRSLSQPEHERARQQRPRSA
jgi:hypothetical protein